MKIKCDAPGGFALGVIFASIVLLLFGCTPIERQAYNVAVASKAFLDSAANAHPECQSLNQAKVCTLIRQARSAKDALIDAAEFYCQSADFGKPGVPCQPPTKGTPAAQIATDKLKAALQYYDAVTRDLKGAL